MQDGKNYLGAEQSPYLLQHRDNPVWWHPWGMQLLRGRGWKISRFSSQSDIPRVTLTTAVAGLKTAYVSKITLAFEFSVLTLTVPGLRLRKVQNPACF
jgi:hypothetical protein